jgi:hypothetical protein
MENKMINIALKRDLKEILENKDNITKIDKSTIGGFSFDIETTQPIASSSYIYYEDEKSMNLDYNNLVNLVKNGK